MREIIVEVDGVTTTLHVAGTRIFGEADGPDGQVYGEQKLELSIEESRDLLTKLRLFSCIRDESEKQLLKGVWDTVMGDINKALEPYRRRDI